MRIKIILAVLLAFFTTACASSGFQVTTRNISPGTAAHVVRIVDAVSVTPKCKAGEVLVTEREADVRTVSDSNGVRGQPNIGQPGQTRRNETARQRRGRQLFVGQETTVRARSDKYCVYVGYKQ